VDTASHPPRIYYERQLKIPPGRVKFDEWIELRLQYLGAWLRFALSNISDNPQIKPEELEKLRFMIEGLLSNVAWITLLDFQRLVRANRITGTESVTEATGKMIEATIEWDEKERQQKPMDSRTNRR
jgi:hypothetical protein